MMKDSSGQVGGLGRAEGDVGRRGVDLNLRQLTIFSIASCADFMPARGRFGLIFQQLNERVILRDRGWIG